MKSKVKIWSFILIFTTAKGAGDHLLFSDSSAETGSRDGKEARGKLVRFLLIAYGDPATLNIAPIATGNSFVNTSLSSLYVWSIETKVSAPLRSNRFLVN